MDFCLKRRTPLVFLKGIVFCFARIDFVFQCDSLKCKMHSRDIKLEFYTYDG